MSRKLLKRCRDTLQTLIECDDDPCQDLMRQVAVIDEYLAQPEPEPVAWLVENHPANDTFANFTPNFNSHFEKLGCKVTPLYTTPPDQSARVVKLESLNADLLRQLSNYQVDWESQEDLLEQLYWEFDADRKKYPENERIRFKGKLRFFAGQVNQYANSLTDAYKKKSEWAEQQLAAKDERVAELEKSESFLKDAIEAAIRDTKYYRDESESRLEGLMSATEANRISLDKIAGREREIESLVEQIKLMNDAALQAREPLSDEEIQHIADGHLCATAQFVGAGEVWIDGAVNFARAIEAAHGIGGE